MTAPTEMYPAVLEMASLMVVDAVAQSPRAAVATTAVVAIDP